MKLFGARAAQEHHLEAPAAILAPGTPAPDFKLPSTTGDPLRLRDLRGRPVVLFFYPADWSPVCGDQAALYNDARELFDRHQAQLVGISVDSIWSHTAFAGRLGLSYPLLADFEPKGHVARLYGAYDQSRGVAQRALFVIDPRGIIHWSHLSPPAVNPGARGILQALQALHPSE